MSWKVIQTVYVSHSFEAKEYGEITIKEGEIVQVIEKDDAYNDGWWRGRNARGQIGLFPVNYTSPTAPGVATLDQKIGSLEHAISELHDARCRCTSTHPSHLPSDHLPPLPSSKRPAPVSNKEQQQSSSTTKLHQALDASPVSPPLQSLPPDKWTVDQVALWIKTIGFETISETFRDQEITGDILLEMTPELLKELGITTFGKRFKVYSAIKILKDKLALQRQNVALYPSDNSLLSSPERSPSPQTDSNGSTRSVSWQQKPGGGAAADHHRNSRGHHTISYTGISISQSAPISQRQAVQQAIDELVPHAISSNPGTQQTLTRSTSLDRGKSSTAAGKQRPPHETTRFKEVRFDTTSQEKSLSWSTSCSSSAAPSKYLGFFISPPRDDRKSDININDTWQPDMEGWLHKHGYKYKTWNKRWFILKGPNLFYFKNPRDLVVKARICLTNYRILTDEHIYPGKYCFKAQNERERTFYFYTDSEQSMKDWIHALLKATIVRDYNTPVRTSSCLKTIPLDEAQRMNPRPPSIIMQSKRSGYPNSSSMFDNRPFSEPNNDHAQTLERGTGQNQQKWGGLSRSVSSSSALRQRKYAFSEEDPVGTEASHEHHHLRWANKQMGHTIKWNTVDYINWVNQYLTRPIDRLDKMRRGEPLAELLENISRKPIQRPMDQKSKSSSMHMLDTIVAAFGFMGREGIKMNGLFTIKEVFSGNEEKIILMLDAIRDRWELSVAKNNSFPHSVSST